MTLAPVLVTVEPPNTAKRCTAPSDGACADACDAPEAAICRDAQKFTLPAPAPIRPPPFE
jgi:hypothetical protein